MISHDLSYISDEYAHSDFAEEEQYERKDQQFLPTFLAEEAHEANEFRRMEQGFLSPDLTNPTTITPSVGDHQGTISNSTTDNAEERNPMPMRDYSMQDRSLFTTSTPVPNPVPSVTVSYHSSGNKPEGSEKGKAPVSDFLRNLERPPNVVLDPMTGTFVQGNSSSRSKIAEDVQEMSSGNRLPSKREFPPQLQLPFPQQVPQYRTQTKLDLNHRAPQEEEEHIKRPMNAFMIWSVQERQRLREGEMAKSHNTVISQELGRRWKMMSKEEKRPYFDKSAEIKALHLQKYPNYKLRLNRNKKRGKKEYDRAPGGQKRALDGEYQYASPSLRGPPGYQPQGVEQISPRKLSSHWDQVMPMNNYGAQQQFMPGLSPSNQQIMGRPDSGFQGFGKGQSGFSQAGNSGQSQPDSALPELSRLLASRPSADQSAWNADQAYRQETLYNTLHHGMVDDPYGSQLQYYTQQMYPQQQMLGYQNPGQQFLSGFYQNYGAPQQLSYGDYNSLILGGQPGLMQDQLLLQQHHQQQFAVINQQQLYQQQLHQEEQAAATQFQDQFKSNQANGSSSTQDRSSPNQYQTYSSQQALLHQQQQQQDQSFMTMLLGGGNGQMTNSKSGPHSNSSAENRATPSPSHTEGSTPDTLPMSSQNQLDGPEHHLLVRTNHGMMMKDMEAGDKPSPDSGRGSPGMEEHNPFAEDNEDSDLGNSQFQPLHTSSSSSLLSFPRSQAMSQEISPVRPSAKSELFC